MHRICNSLSDGGHEVILVGRLRKGSLALEGKKYHQHRLRLIFSKGKFFYIEYQIRLFIYLLSQPKSIISSVDLDSIFPCLLTAKLKRQPIVFDAHEYFSEVPEVYNRPTIKKIWEMVADFCIPKVNQCYTVGNCLADIFEKKYQKKFKVVRNVPFAKPTPSVINEPPKTPILLYQGMLNKGRGLEQTILAMHTIEQAVLWLVGEGDLSQQLRKMVVDEKLSEKVKFLGFIPPHELDKITAKAYIGINLLENTGLSYYYSLANKTFDYIQAGIPSLQMNFPEYENLQNQYHTFQLLDDLNPETISTAIHSLLSNFEYYQTLQSNCLIARQNLIWEKEVEKLFGIYDSIVDEK